MTDFSPSLGLDVEYKGFVGQIRFIDEQYLTVCIRNKSDGMIGDVCILAYPHEWHMIKLLHSSHS